ncbi:MAG: uncharacterized protein ABA06_03250 [Parcubacteria bacterium C7867-001]|nr:MAG: uncharacterized protein ABA06_03250 [Parcubacteria bacterium C7867-001]
MRKILAAIAAAGALFSATAVAAPTFPAQTGYLVDELKLVPAADRPALEAKMKAAEEQLPEHPQFRIVTVTEKQLDGLNPAEYATELGNKWKVGQKGVDNGVVILVSPKPNNRFNIFIAPAGGIQGILNDAKVARITRESMAPHLKPGDRHWAAAFNAGIDALRKEIEKGAAPEDAKMKEGPPPIPQSALWALGIGALITFIFCFFTVTGASLSGGATGGVSAFLLGVSSIEALAIPAGIGFVIALVVAAIFKAIRDGGGAGEFLDIVSSTGGGFLGGGSSSDSGGGFSGSGGGGGFDGGGGGSDV